MNIFSNKVFIGIAITFVIAGLSAVTSLVPANVAVWLTLIVSALTGIGHASNVVSGVKS